MTFQIVNALTRYFETLYEVNQNVIALCGINVFDIQFTYMEQIEKVIRMLPTLVPYGFNRKQNEYTLDMEAGLLEFHEEIPHIRESYETLLESHKNFLEDIKRLRNQLEHKMHGIRLSSSYCGGASLFEITYVLGKKEIRVIGNDLLNFLKDLNAIFNNIQLKVVLFIEQNGKTDSEYYKRITRFHFTDFNQIYDSKLLRTFRTVILPF